MEEDKNYKHNNSDSVIDDTDDVNNIFEGIVSDLDNDTAVPCKTNVQNDDQKHDSVKNTDTIKYDPVSKYEGAPDDDVGENDIQANNSSSESYEGSSETDQGEVLTGAAKSKSKSVEATETQAKENVNTTRTQKAHVQREKTKNQISHVSFESFIEKFFKDIDYSSFEYITKIKQSAYDVQDPGNEITNREKLISALIDDLGIEKVGPLEKYLRINCIKEQDDTENSNTVIDAFFDENNITSQVEDSEIVKMYKMQMAINNNRKQILKERLRKRMVYKSYLAALKVIDDALIKLYLKRIKNKKKYKNEEFFQEINGILNKRRELKNEIKDVKQYEDCLYEIDDLFLTDNIGTKNVNYEHKDYL